MRKPSIQFWLNLAFVVVLAGLIFGATAQPWFFIVVIVWVIAGGYVVQKGRRERPGPPNLFDDANEHDRPGR